MLSPGAAEVIGLANQAARRITACTTHVKDQHQASLWVVDSAASAESWAGGCARVYSYGGV